MKKITALVSCAVMVIFCFCACGKKTGAPMAGSATTESLLNLIPKDSNVVVVVDLHKVMSTEVAGKAVQDEKNQPKYQEFVNVTGIDPKKDVYLMAMGFIGGPGKTRTEQEGAVIINLRYDKDKLLAKFKEKAKDFKEEEYNGVTIYNSAEAPGKQMASGAFLDASNIVVGSASGVRTVIDIYQKKAEGVTKNPVMAGVIKSAKTDAMFWTAVSLPPEAMKQASSQNPMMKSVENLKALTIFFDYKNKSLLAEIKAAGGTESDNKALADTLTGLKGMGAMAGAKDPSVGELVNKIEITSGSDHVTISANFPEELIEKIRQSAQEKVKGLVKTKAGAEEPAEATGEEKKEE